MSWGYAMPKRGEPDLAPFSEIHCALSAPLFSGLFESVPFGPASALAACPSAVAAPARASFSDRSRLGLPVHWRLAHQRLPPLPKASACKSPADMKESWERRRAEPRPQSFF